MKTFTLETNTQTERYDYLSFLSMDRWAWEFLRRNRAFLTDAATRCDDDIAELKAACADIRLLRPRVSQALAERWGLVIMPDPHGNGFDADIVWNHHAFPHQVEVHCTPRLPSEPCHIWERTVPNCNITHITDSAAREYLLLRGQNCVVQVRCTGMSLLGIEPVRMSLQISDMNAYEKKLQKQKEAFQLYGKGPGESEAKWTKTTQILRNGIIALDCLAAGLSQREVARIVYGARVCEQQWSDDAGALRASLRYAIKKAEHLRDGAYLPELVGAKPLAQLVT